MQIINFEVLVAVAVAAWVATQLIEMIKTPLRPWWDAAPEWTRTTLYFATVIVGALLVWFTALDMLPGFSVVWSPLGRVLTCFAGGFGPSFIYRLWIDKPEAPEALT